MCDCRTSATRFGGQCATVARQLPRVRGIGAGRGIGAVQRGGQLRGCVRPSPGCLVVIVAVLRIGDRTTHHRNHASRGRRRCGRGGHGSRHRRGGHGGGRCRDTDCDIEMIVDDQLAGRFGMRGGGLGSLNRGPCNGLSPVATLGAETCAAFTEARTVAEAPALILGAVDWAAALAA